VKNLYFSTYFMAWKRNFISISRQCALKVSSPTADTTFIPHKKIDTSGKIVCLIIIRSTKEKRAARSMVCVFFLSLGQRTITAFADLLAMWHTGANKQKHFRAFCSPNYLRPASERIQNEICMHGYARSKSRFHSHCHFKSRRLAEWEISTRDLAGT